MLGRHVDKCQFPSAGNCPTPQTTAQWSVPKTVSLDGAVHEDSTMQVAEADQQSTRTIFLCSTAGKECFEKQTEAC